MPTLTAAARDRLVDHARAAAPEECCGVLVATSGGDVVTTVEPAANVAADRRRRYAIDPQVLVDVHRRCREGGGRVVGYYHSHPASDAAPSEHDRADAWPDTSYLIVSLVGGVTLASWRLAGGRFVAEPVVVIESAEDAA